MSILYGMAANRKQTDFKGDNMKTSKIIYSLSIEDIQNVAEEEHGKKLNRKELKIIENKIGDYIYWYEAINFAIWNEVLHKEENN